MAFAVSAIHVLYFKNIYIYNIKIYINEGLIFTSEVFFLCKIVWGSRDSGAGGCEFNRSE